MKMGTQGMGWWGGSATLDEWRNQTCLEVNHSFAGLCDSLQEKGFKIHFNECVHLQQDRYGLVGKWQFLSTITRTPTYQNQILNQVGQTTVGEHEQTGHWSGNTLGVTVALAQLVVVFGRVGLFVTLLGTGATRDELQGDNQPRLAFHGRGREQWTNT